MQDSNPYTNEDGHTVNDLRPPFLIPNLDSYIDGDEQLCALLDLHDEDTIFLLENLTETLERAATMIYRILPNANWLETVVDNARDLAFDI